MGRAANRTTATAASRRSEAPDSPSRTRWSHALIRAELKNLFGGGTDWPTVDEFRHAGRIDLYEAVLTHGGSEFWRQATGCAPPQNKRGGAAGERRAARRWSEDAIAVQLRAFLAERREWPTVDEFNAAGLRGLYLAMLNGRGVPYWAARTGVSLRYGQGGRQYTVDDAIRDAKVVIAACGRLVNEKKLRALGYGRLAEAVARVGGARAFVDAHRLAETD
jgi:hypothetical protein